MLRFHFPKDDSRFRWTNHIKNKMLFYGLGEGRIRRVLKSPKRVDKGIAPGTVAAMQRNDRENKKEEIWVMYMPRTHADSRARTNADTISPRSSASSPRKSAVMMISAWRYPGVSKPGTAIPIPDDIFEELTSASAKLDEVPLDSLEEY